MITENDIHMLNYNKDSQQLSFNKLIIIKTAFLPDFQFASLS